MAPETPPGEFHRDEWGKITFYHNDLSMIIDDFHIVGITALPYEANAPLFVNSYAVLTFSAATQSLQVVRRRNTECFLE
jgi:hypothetical protein